MAEVETGRDGAVLTITLNRPDVLNALTSNTHRELVAALKDARGDDVRAVILTGAGRGFCVGQDLTEFREGAVLAWLGWLGSALWMRCSSRSRTTVRPSSTRAERTTKRSTPTRAR